MDKMIFNIYYMNFAKVYEIKMILSNIIKIGQEVEKMNQQDKVKEIDSSIKAKLGTKILSLFDTEAELGGGYRKNSIETNKMIETFEIKATKSVILDEVIQRSNVVSSLEDIDEGQLIRIDNVKLSLENEEELRTVKLVSNGLLKGLRIPETQDLDINNMFNSMFKDYTYKLKGITRSGENIIVKIPMTFENEFESNYSVDDLFIGKVSVPGIYKGQVKVKELKNTFQFFVNLGSDMEENQDMDGIRDSQYKKALKQPTLISENDRESYHYIDILAILQNINIDDFGE
jgi:uncharacterized protein Veg